jgi:cytochrome b6-f complex iron-sulfur subunit
MSDNGVLFVAIPIIVGLAAVLIVTTARRADRRRAVGTLSWETRRRDRSGIGPAADRGSGPGVTGREIERRAVLARRGDEIDRTPTTTPAAYVSPDPEQIGFTRRQFFNRAQVTLMNVGLGAFGLSIVAFLWPNLGGGAFGSKITAGTLDEVRQGIADGNGFLYLPAGRTWITEYPAAALAKAEQQYDTTVVDGMRAGFVALYQKCPHLGCRVPECLSSQWFECPCHGSQYNRVGEKKGGPAPRGMDHFVLTVSGGSVSVDTSKVIPGAAIGTNTTGQEAEGPHCVSAGGE